MQNLTFKQYVTALTEHNGNCDFIKDPELRKQCKKLMKKTCLEAKSEWNHNRPLDLFVGAL